MHWLRPRQKKQSANGRNGSRCCVIDESTVSCAFTWRDGSLFWILEPGPDQGLAVTHGSGVLCSTLTL
jgi:hypothetical protein